ncbi:MAG: hypothetical protein ACRDNK_11995 [Solirubrobacteraceae bacterium]
MRIISGDSGFDWGDASIGAGAALGLMLAATGGTLLLAHRTDPVTHRELTQANTSTTPAARVTTLA